VALSDTGGKSNCPAVRFFKSVGCIRLDENHGEKVEKSRHTFKKNRKIHGEFTVIIY